MNKQKIFFIISILGILILLTLTQIQKPVAHGKIKSIQYSNNKISIILENNPKEIIIFTNKLLNLKQEQEIIIYGKQAIYKNQEQIIADKIISS